jgi:hypothetical protein
MAIEPFSHGRLPRALYVVVVGLLTVTSGRASDLSFESRQAAEDFIRDALPRATAANPRYLTKSEGIETRWLTKSVRFDEGPSGIRVSMDEGYTRFKSGESTVGTHQAVFSLADVDIYASTEPGDVTPGGEPAMVVMFACAAPKCVSATWNGKAGAADDTDVSVQDGALLARIVAAFRYLKSARRA